LFVYIDAISVNSIFIYMICQALHQPSYKFVHFLYIFVITIIINQLFCTYRN